MEDNKMKELLDASNRFIHVPVEKYDELVSAQAALGILLKLGKKMKSYDFENVIHILAEVEDGHAE